MYCGSDPEASRLCMDKLESKKVVKSAGVGVLLDIFQPEEVEVDEVIFKLGIDLVIKPIDQGSSVALYVLRGRDELNNILKDFSFNWMIESEFSAEKLQCILGDSSLGIVEVIPEGEFMISTENISLAILNIVTQPYWIVILRAR